MAEDTGENLPADPVSELVAAAIVYHQMYTAFQDGGFTREEAMELVIASLQAGMKGFE